MGGMLTAIARNLLYSCCRTPNCFSSNCIFKGIPVFLLRMAMLVAKVMHGAAIHGLDYVMHLNFEPTVNFALGAGHTRTMT
jgi:hypothetical protein